MASEYITLSGKAKWVKGDIPTQYNDWRFDLYPDDASYSKLLELKERGLKNVIKKDEDGYYVSFKRLVSKLIRGKLITWDSPKIIMSNGQPLPRDVQVGNGSDVTAELEIYFYPIPGGTSKGIASRWVAMKVQNLVPFEFNKDMTEDEQLQVRNLMKAPAQELF